MLEIAYSDQVVYLKKAIGEYGKEVYEVEVVKRNVDVVVRNKG